MKALLAVLLLLIPAAAFAQDVPLYNLDTQILSILPASEGGTPTEYRLYCNGALRHTFVDVEQPYAGLRDLLESAGDYTCFATAVNGLGESAPSMVQVFKADAVPDAVDFTIGKLEEVLERLKAVQGR